MLTLRRWPLLAVALIVSLLAPGCGHGPPAIPGQSGSNGTNVASDTPGAAEAHGMPGNNGRAHGAPITIPNIIQSQGEPVDAVRESLLNGFPIPGETNGYDGIIAQCGGHLCVTIDVKVGSTNHNLINYYNQCTSIGETDPPGNSVVYPGDTIWILTGAQPCPPPSSEPPTPGSESPTPGSESPSPGSESPTYTPSP
jgi:hypothetical protein